MPRIASLAICKKNYIIPQKFSVREIALARCIWYSNYGWGGCSGGRPNIM
jgi:hypothetical protein